jgi:hypothetical protein
VPLPVEVGGQLHEDSGVTVAALPEGPEDRWAKWGDRAILAALAVILVLFVFSMLDSYVF